MARLLIIDDDPQIRNMLKLFLEKCGYSVLEAENGHTAIELCKSNRFDLIIVDIYMPIKDGIAFIHELRGFSPDVGVIAISGGERGHYFTSDTKLDVAMSVGALRTLKKPFRLEDLLATVKELLHQKPDVQEETLESGRDKKTQTLPLEQPVTSPGIAKTIRATFRAKQDQLYQVSIAVANLAGKSDDKQVLFNLTATSEKGYDSAWIHKKFEKIIREAGIDKVTFDVSLG